MTSSFGPSGDETRPLSLLCSPEFWKFSILGEKSASFDLSGEEAEPEPNESKPLSDESGERSPFSRWGRILAIEAIKSEIEF